MANTRNHGYNVPDAGVEDWHEPLNENFERYDTDIEVRDEAANRSDYEPKAGAKFVATDTEAVFVGDGSSWNELETSGRTPTFAALNADNRFLGVGRDSRVTGAEYLGVQAPVGGSSYGGMYVNTAGSSAQPFYGYATGGEARAWTYYHAGSNQWRLNNSGDVLAVGPNGNVGVGTTSITGNKLTVDGRNEGSYGLTARWSGNSLGAAVLADNAGSAGDGLQAFGGSGRSAIFARAESADLSIRADGDVQVDGDLSVSGSVGSNVKNFVETVDTDDGPREVTYTSVESDRAHTETSGVVELEDGRAEVDLPDHFGWVTSDEDPLVVQVTPHAAEPVRPQVTERSTHLIVVEDVEDPARSYEVSYTVTGTRAGFEDVEVVRNPDTR